MNRARHRADLVTDERKALDGRLESAARERLAALESLEPAAEEARRPAPGTVQEPSADTDKHVDRGPDPEPNIAREWRGPDPEQ